MDYTAVKHLHLAAIATSLALFVLRLTWRTTRPARLAMPWVRVVPHVVDTVLLLSGAWLAWQLGGTGVRGWLPAKLVGVLAYIVLGSVALKRARTPAARLAAAAGALLTFGYIVAVAITKSPLGRLAA